MSHTAFGDAIGGLNGCVAVLAALIHARRTGEGQFIDLSQIEAMMPFAAPWVIKHSIDGKEPTRYGNRHPDYRAARRVPLRRPRRLDRGGVFIRRDVAEAVPAAEARATGLAMRRWRRPPAAAPTRTRSRQAIEEWTNTRDPETRDARIAGGGHRRRRGAAAGRDC